MKEKIIHLLQVFDLKQFVKFGLIPEFVGRVPVTVSLEALDKAALVRILKEPRNSLLRQYQALFELDGVSLIVQHPALIGQDHQIRHLHSLFLVMGHKNAGDPHPFDHLL